MEFWPEDWSAVLAPQGPVAELFVRATAIYFFLFVLMRVAGRRLFAKLSMSDILLVLLLAVAVREGITGGHHGVGDAAIAAGTLLFWNRVVDRLAYEFPRLRRALRHGPRMIIRDGHPIHENVRANLLTETEILQRIREQGLSSMEQVGEAYLEQDGSLSIVPR